MASGSASVFLQRSHVEANENQIDGASNNNNQRMYNMIQAGLAEMLSLILRSKLSRNSMAYMGRDLLTFLLSLH